ncbi:MAG: carbamate kinase [Myxococcota bacterium]
MNHDRSAIPVLVAMGGNSLLDPAKPPTVDNQFAVTAAAVIPVADLIQRGVHIVLTHGNGPQVGFMLLRSDAARQVVHQVPLDSLVADSQGAIGYMIQRLLRDELARRGVDHTPISIVTQVEVDPNDKAFQKPTKPIGKFYSAEEAEDFKRNAGWDMVEDSRRGYRRVVSSPSPVSILELGAIKMLVENGATVIACGGGGIPVKRTPDGWRGVEAVIDKDRASALLAAALGVKRFFITTGVDAVYVDYQTDHRRALHQVTIAELRRLEAEGQFPPGSMGPKVEAAMDFLENGGEEVIICTPEALADAYDGRAGTRVTKD